MHSNASTLLGGSGNATLTATLHPTTHLGLEVAEAAPLFNVHEIWAISLASIFFLVGAPSNLVSIIVCLRSLVIKPALMRQRLFHHHNHRKQAPSPQLGAAAANGNGHYRKPLLQRRNQHLNRANDNNGGGDNIKFEKPLPLTLPQTPQAAGSPLVPQVSTSGFFNGQNGCVERYELLNNNLNTNDLNFANGSNNRLG
jgi:hypothetical protein